MAREYAAVALLLAPVAAAEPSAAAAGPTAGPSAAAAGPPAAAAGPSAAAAGAREDPDLCVRAACFVTAAAVMVEGYGTLLGACHDRTLATALLAALSESRLLDHAGRLLLLLLPAPGAGAQAVPEALLDAHLVACSTFIRATEKVSHVLAAELAVGAVQHPHGMYDALGPCGAHALVVLGAATLASADLQPYGLSYDPLPKPLPSAPPPHDAVWGMAISAGIDALTVQLSLPPGAVPCRCSPRAALRLAVRVLRLAGTSLCAAVAFPMMATFATMQVELNMTLETAWSGGRQADAHTIGRVLKAGDAAPALLSALKLVQMCSRRMPRAWAAKAAAAWPVMLSAVRHYHVAKPGPGSALAVQVLVDLLGKAAPPSVASPGPPPPLTPSLAQLPPLTAAALAGGAVPLLETLFRCAGDDPTGPEAYVAECILASRPGRSCMIALLPHSPPRQAAAFIATLAKLLRRTRALDLIVSNFRPAGLPLAVELVTAAWRLWEAEAAGPGPPGPVDPSQPCAPLWVLALAALRLLPELSRLTREAVRLRLARGPAEGSPGPGQAQPGPGSGAGATLSAAVGTGAARREALDDVLWMWWGGPETAFACHLWPSQHCLTGALSLRSLAEEAAAVPLLGALMNLAMRPDGELPASWPKLLGYSLVCLVDTCPQQVWACGNTGPGGGTGAEAGPEPGSAWACWRPEALRGLALRLRDTEPALSEDLEGFAVILRGAPTSDPELREPGTDRAPTLASAALAALREQASTVLPACANPACVSLAGDSEAGLKLQQCGRCGRASYCCRDCQTAHWRAGHKAVCGTAVAGGVGEGAGA